MNAERYLSRIGLKESSLPPTAQTLETLQRAHLYAVPYDNLDILAGKPIAPAREALYEKIVTRRPGGHCFELNGLFRLLLRPLGSHRTDRIRRSPPSRPPSPSRPSRPVSLSPPPLLFFPSSFFFLSFLFVPFPFFLPSFPSLFLLLWPYGHWASAV